MPHLLLPMLKREDEEKDLWKWCCPSQLCLKCLLNLLPTGNGFFRSTWPRLMQILNVACRSVHFFSCQFRLQSRTPNAWQMSSVVVWHCQCSLSLTLFVTQKPDSLFWACVCAHLLRRPVLHLLLCSSVVQPKLPDDWWTFEICNNMQENRKVNMSINIGLREFSFMLLLKCTWCPSKCRIYLESLGQPFNHYVISVSPTFSRLTKKATTPFIQLANKYILRGEQVSWFACLVYFC